MMFDIPTNNAPIIKVIGVGGGGGNAVSHMYSKGIKGVDFAICNTDAQAMENSNIPTKISLGPNLTGGNGAGNIPDVGKEACIESIDEVRAFLENTKMLFVTAGMGGGTGTGAAPIIAKAAREMGVLTVGIVTAPFSFEGRQRLKQAGQGLEKLKENVDSLIIISNDKLFDLFPDLDFDDAFIESDNVLLTAAKGIAEIITVHGKVNVDFADVHTVMKDSGPSIMGNGIASGENRALTAIQDAINSPLLEDDDIKGAKNILLNITAGTTKLKLKEMNQITSYVEDKAGVGTDVIWGSGTDENLGDKLSVTIIATGFQDSQNERAKSNEEVKVEQPVAKIPEPTVEIINLYDEVEAEPQVRSVEDNTRRVERSQEPITPKDPYGIVDVDQRPNVVDLGIDTPVRKIDTSSQYSEDLSPRYDDSLNRTQRVVKKARPLFATIGEAESYHNKQVFANLENVPAYKRLNVELEDVNKTTSPMDQYNTITIDESGEIVANKNSFFEDNVD